MLLTGTLCSHGSSVMEQALLWLRHGHILLEHHWYPCWWTRWWGYPGIPKCVSPSALWCDLQWFDEGRLLVRYSASSKWPLPSQRPQEWRHGFSLNARVVRHDSVPFLYRLYPVASRLKSKIWQFQLSNVIVQNYGIPCELRKACTEHHIAIYCLELWSHNLQYQYPVLVRRVMLCVSIYEPYSSHRWHWNPYLTFYVIGTLFFS